MTDASGAPEAERELRCSAKGCREQATFALLWNNPTLHTADRRKVWLACPDHVASLGDFLSLRGFLRDTIGVGELTDAHG